MTTETKYRIRYLGRTYQADHFEIVGRAGPIDTFVLCGVPRASYCTAAAGDGIESSNVTIYTVDRVTYVSLPEAPVYAISGARRLFRTIAMTV